MASMRPETAPCACLEAKVHHLCTIAWCTRDSASGGCTEEGSRTRKRRRKEGEGPALEHIPDKMSRARKVDSKGEPILCPSLEAFTSSRQWDLAINAVL